MTRLAAASAALAFALGCSRTRAAETTPAPAAASTPAVPEALQPAPDCRQPVPHRRCAKGLCRIEPGCFVMGAPRTEPGVARYTDRQVQVTLTRAFLIGETEVTRRQWSAAGFPLPRLPATGESRSEKTACHAPDCPVEGVSFFDAVAFANRASERQGLPACYVLKDCSGTPGAGLTCGRVDASTPTLVDCRGYRLPTEAEWEYAARAGTTTAFFTGDPRQAPAADASWTPASSRSAGTATTPRRSPTPSRGKRPNAWGLFDVIGNVVEWCNNLKSAAGYGAGPLVDPLLSPRPSPDLRPDTTHPQRIVRGGSYAWPASMAKASWRASLPDETVGPNVGLRLARTAPRDREVVHPL